MADEVDLDALLESALEDFKKEPTPPKPTPVAQPVPVQTSTPNAPPDMDDELLKDLMNDPMKALSNLLNNPELKGEFEKDLSTLMSEFNLKDAPFDLESLQKELSELSSTASNTPPAATPTPNPNAPPTPNPEGLSGSLDTLLNSAQEILNTGDLGDFSEESLKQMFSDFEKNPEMMDVMETVMDKFMSKEVLRDGLSELRDKFSNWLKKKDGLLTAEDKNKYEQQLSSIERVLTLYDSDCETGPGAAQTEELMKQMETVGTLPDELLQELGKSEGAPCTIM